MKTKHPNRKPIRLRQHDYSSLGMYFITICTYQKKCLFGAISEGAMTLNKFGKIAQDNWLKISQRFANVQLDEFVIMPNHLHGIIFISDELHNCNKAGASPAPTVGNIVGAYKSLVFRECLEISKKINPNFYLKKLWQRNYYDHIIRNEKSFDEIRKYIVENPLNWNKDDLFQ
jgi:putative transposase